MHLLLNTFLVENKLNESNLYVKIENSSNLTDAMVDEFTTKKDPFPIIKATFLIVSDSLVEIEIGTAYFHQINTKHYSNASIQNLSIRVDSVVKEAIRSVNIHSKLDGIPVNNPNSQVFSVSGNILILEQMRFLPSYNLKFIIKFFLTLLIEQLYSLGWFDWLIIRPDDFSINIDTYRNPFDFELLIMFLESLNFKRTRLSSAEPNFSLLLALTNMD